MPELPEVETVKRIIEPQIVGQKIIDVLLDNPQVLAHPDKDAFKKELKNQTISSMSRKGKFLTIHFASNARLVLHLRMTGQLLVTAADFPLEKHTHLISKLANGRQIRYIDVRRFGRFWFLKKDEADTVTGQDKLGLEPFDKKLTASFLKSKASTRKRAVKDMLLDQTIVAGIGNIYADEILFAAKIHPQESCCNLSDSNWRELAKKIKEIIVWGIDTNKISADEYLAGKGKEYRNTPLLKIYAREGLPCTECKTPIKRIVIAGRSSCFCPHCQKKKA